MDKGYAFCGVRGIAHPEAKGLMESDVRVQFVDARVVFGTEHVASAAEHAIRAFKRGRNVCREMRAEFMLYMSGQRQISTAIRIAGLRRDTESCAMVVFGPKRGEPGSIVKKMGWVRDDGVLSPVGKDLSTFGIEGLETGATDRVEDLVLERVALVDILKRG